MQCCRCFTRLSLRLNVSHTGHMLMNVDSVYASARDGPSLSGANRAVHIQCS